MRKFILLVLAAMVACTRVSAAQGTFAAFVDTYLDTFGHFHPSIAAGNGLHAHDGD